jgi:hypothetical protein
MDIDKIIKQVANSNTLYLDPDKYTAIHAFKNASRDNNEAWYRNLPNVIKCLDSEPYWIIYDNDDDLFVPFMLSFNKDQLISHPNLTKKYLEQDPTLKFPPQCNKIFIACSYNFDISVGFLYKGYNYVEF